MLPSDLSLRHGFAFRPLGLGSGNANSLKVGGSAFLALIATTIFGSVFEIQLANLFCSSETVHFPSETCDPPQATHLRR